MLDDRTWVGFAAEDGFPLTIDDDARSERLVAMAVVVPHRRAETPADA